MAPSKGPCPGIEQIERLASGEADAEVFTSHVESCPACRAMLEAAKDEAKFVQRVRVLASPALGPEGAPLIPGYHVLDVLSAGAQGVVYRAVQESTSRTVAIKTRRAGEATSSRQRFRAEREAEIAARLRHPNIVTVFESRALWDGRIAVVMEFVDGMPLDQWTPPGTTEAERQRELLRVFAAACNGIHHAHLNGVIHRDVKPDNILVTPEGRPVVLDFGIAKAGGLHTTLTGEFAGTPAYASPEQVSGRSGEVDALTDVYSLGVILYRILCGKMPYEVEGSIFEIARTISEAEPVQPRTCVPGLAVDLEAIILRAMRKEKERRYQSAAALARDIERYLAGDPVEARAGSGWYLLRKAVVLNRWRLVWAGAAVVVLLGAGLAVVFSMADAAESAKLAKLRQEQAKVENTRARAVTELLREALPSSDPTHPELAAAVGAGLSRLYFRLETGAFADDPEMDQAIRRLWGGIYTGFGSGKESSLVEYSEVSLRNGLVRLRTQYGPEHPDIAASMHELAGVLLVRKRAAEAERICRDAVAMRAKLLGPDNVATINSRALLARILIAVGRAGEAVAEADAALAAFRTLPGREADLQIASMTALKGRVELDAKSAGSEPLVREALVRRVRRLPPHDPELLASLSDAADVADLWPNSALAADMSKGWAPGAIAAEVRADIPILASSNPSDYAHPLLTGRTAAIGRLLSLEEQLLGSDDPALVTALTAQMQAGISEHLPDQRCRAAIRAAAIVSRRFGPDDLSVLAFIDDASSTLAYAGDPERAAELARRACDIWASIPQGARDPILSAISRRHLAFCLALSEKYDEAIGAYNDSLSMLRKAGGPDHALAVADAGLAYCLLETGQTARADELSEQAVGVLERFAATPPDQKAHILFARGHVLHSLHRYAEARTMLEGAWKAAYSISGASFPWRRVFAQDLVGACTEMGDKAGADRWLAAIQKADEDDKAKPAVRADGK